MTAISMRGAAAARSRRAPAPAATLSLLALALLACACGDRSTPSMGPPPVARDPATGEPCPAPELQAGLPGDATSDAAAGEAPLFRRIAVPGVTDLFEPNGSLPALVDLDRDGRTDVVLALPRSIDFFHNAGCFRFERRPLRIVDSGFTVDAMPASNQGLIFADLNDDGYLDGLVTGPGAGNELLLSQGAHDVFRDVAGDVGIRNTGAYSRQAQLGDVDGDGHLDIAIGADQIGVPEIGVPWQRLFVYDAAAGSYRDVGGTDAVPGFGGKPNCDPEHDRQSPGILLRDLSGAGSLDLVQGYHNDMTFARNGQACTTGERTYGVFAWRNLQPGDGTVRFAEVPPGSNGLTDRGKLRFVPERRDYDVLSHGIGLPYIVAFDAFNSGRLDLLAVGPTDPMWHINSDPIAGRFYANLGDFQFRDATDEVGLAALSWSYGQWADFWGAEVVPSPLGGIGCIPASAHRAEVCAGLAHTDIQMYASSVVWGDFDNDGFVDFVLSDRRESPENAATLRNVLFRNDGAGRFAPVVTEESGLETNSEVLEAADLDGDGRLDLVSGQQPFQSYFFATTPGHELPHERSLAKVYWNTGALGGATNHWVEVTLAGLPDRLLIGAQLTLEAARDGGRDPLPLGRRDYFPNDAYKAGHELLVHWGLGQRTAARVTTRLPSGETFTVGLPCVDARVTIDAASRGVSGCRG